MALIPHIIRAALTLLLIYGAYTETGVWTALNLLGIWLSIEINSYRIGMRIGGE